MRMLERMRRRRLRLGAAALLLALFSAACGPRFDLSTLGEDGGGSGPTRSGDDVGVTGGGGDPADERATTGADRSAGGESSSGSGAPGGGTSGGTTAPEQPPDNGGATDVGVTATSVAVGASVAVGGPLAGQFLPASQGISSYYRMINEAGGIYGRQILYHHHDDALSRDKYRDNVTHLIQEDEVFALTGGMSAADDGGCGFTDGVPDIGTFALNYCRAQADDYYSPMGSLKEGIYGCCAEWTWLRERFAYEQPAVEYLTDFAVSQNQGLAVVDGLVRTLGANSRDAVVQGENRATQPDYNGEVLRLRGEGVDAVFSSMDLPSNVRLVRAMCQQSFVPKVVHLEISTYDPTFFDRVSPDCIETQNIYLRTPHLPFSRTDNAEMRRYLDHLERFHPDTQPTTFGIEGWLSGKLFVEALRSAGPRLTREKLSTALDAVEDWTGGGLIGPNTPSDRLIYHCNLMLHLEAGTFAPKSDFLCGKFYRSGDFTGPAVGP